MHLVYLLSILTSLNTLYFNLSFYGDFPYPNHHRLRLRQAFVISLPSGNGQPVDRCFCFFNSFYYTISCIPFPFLLSFLLLLRDNPYFPKYFSAFSLLRVSQFVCLFVFLSGFSFWSLWNYLNLLSPPVLYSAIFSLKTIIYLQCYIYEYFNIEMF